MRRAVRKVSLLAALGLLASVAVAWTSAATIDLWADIWLQTHGVSSSTYPCWGIVTIHRPFGSYVFRTAISRPHTRGVGWLDELAPPFWSAANEPPSTEPLDTWAGHAEDGRGWPFICLASTIDATISTRGWTYGRVSWGMRLPSTQGPDLMPRSLPLRPIWIGLLADTVFYGLLILLIFHAIRLSRRRHRTRQGRCARCGYPAGPSPRCPECGELLPLAPNRGVA